MPFCIPRIPPFPFISYDRCILLTMATYTQLKTDNPSFVLHGVHDVKIEEVSDYD